MRVPRPGARRLRLLALLAALLAVSGVALRYEAFGSGGRRESSFVRHAFAVAPRELYSCPFELEQIGRTPEHNQFVCGFGPLLTHPGCAVVLLADLGHAPLADRLRNETECSLDSRALDTWQAEEMQWDGLVELRDGTWTDLIVVDARTARHAAVLLDLAFRPDRPINASQILLEVHAAVAGGADDTAWLRGIFDGFAAQGFRITALAPLLDGRLDALAVTLVKVGGNRLEPENERVVPWHPEAQPSWAFCIAHFVEPLHWLPQLQAWAPPGTPIELYTHNNEYRDASVPGATVVRIVEPNIGLEATSYLAYLADHHPSGFADVTIFLHGHRVAWHSFDILAVLPQIAPTLGIRSYMSVNYPDHEFIGADRLNVTRRLRLIHRWCSEGLGPREGVQNLAPDEPVEEGYSHIAEFWGEMFESQLGPIPDEIVRDCCGQHALSRPAILCYSKETYTGWLDTTYEKNDTRLPRIWEYMWRHIYTLPHEPVGFRETFTAAKCRDCKG